MKFDYLSLKFHNFWRENSKCFLDIIIYLLNAIFGAKFISLIFTALSVLVGNLTRSRPG